MSMAFYVVAEREVPGFDLFIQGEALGRSSELERLAELAGVRPLMDFFGAEPEESSPVVAGARELSERRPQVEVAWYPAEEGLASVRGMLRYLAAHPDCIDDADEIRFDLEDMEMVLGRLARESIRWYLAVDD